MGGVCVRLTEDVWTVRAPVRDKARARGGVAATEVCTARMSAIRLKERHGLTADTRADAAPSKEAASARRQYSPRGGAPYLGEEWNRKRG